MKKMACSIAVVSHMDEHVSFLLILCQLGVMIGCRHGLRRCLVLPSANEDSNCWFNDV